MPHQADRAYPQRVERSEVAQRQGRTHSQEFAATYRLAAKAKGMSLARLAVTVGLSNTGNSGAKALARGKRLSWGRWLDVARMAGLTDPAAAVVWARAHVPDDSLRDASGWRRRAGASLDGEPLEPSGAGARGSHCAKRGGAGDA